MSKIKIKWSPNRPCCGNCDHRNRNKKGGIMALFRCNKHNISLEEYGIINIGIANVYCSDHKEYKKIENNNSFKYKCTDCLFIGKYKKLINEKCPDCGAKVFQARE